MGGLQEKLLTAASLSSMAGPRDAYGCLQMNILTLLVVAHVMIEHMSFAATRQKENKTRCTGALPAVSL